MLPISSLECRCQANGRIAASSDVLSAQRSETDGLLLSFPDSTTFQRASAGMRRTCIATGHLLA
eukprot:4154238-Prymnesium_polylepis.1